MNAIIHTGEEGSWADEDAGESATAGAAGTGSDCWSVLDETVEVGVDGGPVWAGGVLFIVILGMILFVTPYLASEDGLSLVT